MNDLDQFRAMLDDWGVDHTSATDGTTTTLNVMVMQDGVEGWQMYEFVNGKLSMFADRKV